MPGLKLVLLRALAASSAAFFLASATAARPEEPMLLVAKRGFEDPVYGSTIVLARPVQGGGHVGFIVNKPTKLNLAELFPEHEPSKKVADPLFLGGTVDMNLVFALVEEHGSRKDGSIRIAPDIFLAYDTKAVDRIIESERSEEHTSELQSRLHLVCRLLHENEKLIVRLDLPAVRVAGVQQHAVAQLQMLALLQPYQLVVPLHGRDIRVLLASVGTGRHHALA